MTLEGSSSPRQDPQPRDIDTSVAHVARVYDYLLGGKANFAVDREAAARAYAAWPGGLAGVRADARAHRALLGRVVRYLVTEAGIRQFLDIGTGIPKENNVHEVAQNLAPAARIVYVDYDPIVLAHAHRLLTSTPQGACAYVRGDLRDPDAILRRAMETLDLGQPAAILLFGILHFFADDDDPCGIVAALVDGMAPGSYLALTHLAKDIQGKAMTETFAQLNEQMNEDVTLRTRDEISRFFDGMRMVPPGVAQVPQWRPVTGAPSGRSSSPMPMWCGVAQSSEAGQPHSSHPASPPADDTAGDQQPGELQVNVPQPPPRHLHQPRVSFLRWRKAFRGFEREVRTVRQWIAGLLPECPSRDDVVTVAVELVTNALRFTASGRGGDTGWFAVELTWHNATLQIAVADGGGPPDGPVLTESPGNTDSEHGRGLHLVRALSARTGVCGDQHGRVVWADVPWVGDSPPALLTQDQETAIRDQEAVLAVRYAGASSWFGRTTLQWWALPATSGELVSASSATELAGLLDRVPGTRDPHAAAPPDPGTVRAGRRSTASTTPARSRRHLRVPIVRTA